MIWDILGWMLAIILAPFVLIAVGWLLYRLIVLLVILAIVVFLACFSLWHCVRYR